MESQYFILFSHNVIVEGKERSAIYDLQNEALVFIPNVLVIVLNALRENTVGEVIAKMSPNQPELIQKYIDFLLQKDLGFYTSNPDDFPGLDLDFQSPSIIQSAVLEYSIDQQLYSIENLVTQLNDMLCQYVELRIVDEEVKLDALLKVIAAFDNSTMSSIHLIIPQKGLSNDDIIAAYSSSNKIQDILVHKAAANAALPEHPNNIVLSKEDLFSSEHKKPFPQDQHIVNMLFFTEAQHYNVYYNKKVSIAVDGDIKNCLLNKNDFGNLNDQSLLDVVESESFRKFWMINADKIEGVKDSALRYCTLYSSQPEKTENGLYELLK